jgi:hypothetical protein
VLRQPRKREERCTMTKPYDIPKALVWEAYQYV